ncbi:hypothetical protein AAE02nite_31620 [Adhaeribacter aerolatus]|uniref:Uncharacterized protein n=1 Tax=Adhaeribacter aerolatus TaxID=670289 RepID=A0A512B0K3_9BACT|nr:hypothetical protein AAE02nite_31620 [Adhaeribacter aerolatus]
MDVIPYIIIVSLTIGLLCTYVLSRNERQEFMERETYKTLSIISFLFNMTGSILCMFMLSQ